MVTKHDPTHGNGGATQEYNYLEKCQQWSMAIGPFLFG
jgi:hypothetical protein